MVRKHIILKEQVKTRRYPAVYNRKRQHLGQIGYQDEWTEYIFMPDDGTFYSSSCLREIADALDKTVEPSIPQPPKE